MPGLCLRLYRSSRAAMTQKRPSPLLLALPLFPYTLRSCTPLLCLCSSSPPLLSLNPALKYYVMIPMPFVQLEK
jgi:hypothetical protein